jgi:formylglycine-generating enzyme required for sulfatase activity
VSDPSKADSVFADWLHGREQGGGSTIDDLVRQHPDIASELRLRLEALRVVDQVFAAGPPPPPEQVGRYRILRELGRGGMGIVYEAQGPDRDESVALKVLYRGHSDSPDLLRRLQRQVAASQALAHPAIVCIFRVEQADGRWCCVSDYVRGCSLDKLVAELGDMAQPASSPDVTRLVTDRAGRAAELFAPLADALQFAHDKGVIHRDIKPSNLILGDDGRLRLTDLDLARIGGESGAITRTGAVLGTPHYMSPEQALGAPVDARTDIYSLGATMYEWVTLERPFRGETAAEVTTEILAGRPRRIPRGVSRDLGTIILKAMEREPDRRYASAGALAEDLRRLSSGRRIVARPPSLLRRARRIPRGVAASLLLVACAVPFVAWAAGRDAERWLGAARRSLEDGRLRQAIDEIEASLAIDPGSREARDLAADCERRREAALAGAAALEREIEGKGERKRQSRADLERAETQHEELFDRCFKEWTPGDAHGSCHAAERAIATAEATLGALDLEIDALERRVERLRELQPGAADAVEAELVRALLGRWREARLARDGTRQEVFLAFARSHGAAEPVTRGILRIAADATLHLYRFEARGAVPRLLPIPTRRREAVLEPPEECQVITDVVPGSPAALAGLVPGDLVVGLGGAPCGRGLFVAGVTEEGPAERAGVQPLDRIERNGDWPVESLSEWGYRQEGQPPQESVSVLVGAKEIRIPWGTSPADATGIECARPETLIAALAPPNGMRLSCLRGGRPMELEIPPGARAGIACEPTAYPLVLSEANRVASGELEVEGGSYLLHAQREGCEAQRVLVVVPDGGTAEARVSLLPSGSTPRGFVHVAAGGFFIARFELTTGEYLEFLNDPEVRARILAALERGECILFPRDSGGWHPRDPGALTEILPDGTLRHKRAADTTPIRGISFEDALAYVAWRNARGGPFRYALASEEQWEAAARGADGRLYPWGDRFDFTFCVGEHWRRETDPFAPVGSEPRDESPCGVRDLAGSRREWTSPGVLRGGHYWAGLAAQYLAAGRDLCDPAVPHRYWGIRLVAVPRVCLRSRP